MRLSRMRFTIRSMMVGVVVLGIASWEFARYQRWSYYDMGWWEAEREIWRGELTIYRVGGLRWFGEICRVDRATGLPIEDIGGCVVDEGLDQRIHGHNDHVAQYLRWRGLPKTSLKRWEKELFELARYFDIRARIEREKPLCAGGPVLTSPHGRIRVQPVAGTKYDGSLSDRALDLVISADDVVVSRTCVRFGKGDSSLVWGPIGSGFVVVRTLAERKESFAAYSLESGWLLRTETWMRERLRESNRDQIMKL